MFRLSNKEKEKDYFFYKEIFENSPAEISVIEMEDPNKFNIVYINKLKSISFGIEDKTSIIGKKCYTVFEPNRVVDDECQRYCMGCPSLEAYKNEGTIIHRDWPYFNNTRKENKFVSLTAQRIPNSTKVIEICRDSTIRKVISDLIYELGTVTSKQKIEDIILKAFLEKLYFERCRIYDYSDSKKSFTLKRFIKIENRSPKTIPTYKDIDFKKEFSNKLTEDDIINKSTKAVPQIYFAKDYFTEPFKKTYYKGLNENQFHNDEIFNKKEYPVWIDIPIVSTNKVIGKISIDKKPSNYNSPEINIEDYDIEIIGLFGQTIGNIIEKIYLLDLTILHEINEIVLRNDKNKIDENLSQILIKGCEYLGFEDGKIIIEINQKVKIIKLDSGKIETPYYLDYYETIYSEILNRKEFFQNSQSIIFDLYLDKSIKSYKDVNTKHGKRYCLLNAFFDENRNVLGAWYLESDNVFDEETLSRIKMFSNQTAIAIINIKQYQELENEKNLANKFQKEAEKTLKVREAFLDQLGHELLDSVKEIVTENNLILNCYKRDKSISKELAFKQIEDNMNSAILFKHILNDIDFRYENNIENNYEIVLIENPQIILLGAVQMLEKKAHAEKQIEIRTNISNMPSMYLDNNRVKQVFINLIKNAIQYSNKNSIINIYYSQIQGEFDNTGFKSWHEIKFSNWGIGIQEEDKEIIFDLYTRSKNAIKVRPSGSGIGLNIVKNIMKAHQGHCIVKRNTNPTEIAIYFPIKKLLK